MRKAMTWLLCMILLLSFGLQAASGEEVARDPATCLGTMRVINCKNWVSLRAAPDQTSDRLAKVPLGDLVYDCYKDVKGFIYCQYQGKHGYILMKYLEVVSGALAAPSSRDEQKMSMEEIENAGEIVLDWNEYNVRVLATREERPEDKEKSEILRVGCFIDGQPIWGYTTSAGDIGDYTATRAFMGGTRMDPQVLVYNAAYGLTMLDLLSGRELWTLSAGACPLGDAAAFAVGEDGIMYFAGTDGPAPVAVSSDGQVLWKSKVKDPEVYGPYEIELGSDEIRVKYASGLESGYKLVSLEYNGTIIGIREVAF